MGSKRMKRKITTSSLAILFVMALGGCSTKGWEQLSQGLYNDMVKKAEYERAHPSEPRPFGR